MCEARFILMESDARAGNLSRRFSGIEAAEFQLLG
jgi:hypothetical protein